MSLAILYKDIAICFKALWVSTNASWAAIPSNLLADATNEKLVNSLIFCTTNSAYPEGAFNPVPTAVPPIGRLDKCDNEFFNAVIPDSNCVT